MHPKCLEIAERVVDLKKSVLGDAVSKHLATSLGRLYAILRRRCVVQAQVHGIWPHEPPFLVVWEPHEFFGIPYDFWWDKDWAYREGDPDCAVRKTKLTM